MIFTAPALPALPALGLTAADLAALPYAPLLDAVEPGPEAESVAPRPTAEVASER